MKHRKNISLLTWNNLVEGIKTNTSSRVGVPTEISWDGPVHIGGEVDDVRKFLAGSMVVIGQKCYQLLRIPKDNAHAGMPSFR